ncbi:cache domain-containing protein [Paenibacillus taichungensis]|uniref:cache domain-containing protein n=1 Tax=Paenibacillus taichungensis TaxID=484184 RepID=UPI003D9A1FA5
MLFSYMPIFIVVITFTFFVFFQILSEQSRKEALNANKMLSLQAMRLIDTSLKAIDNMIMSETINNKQLIDFFNNEEKNNIFINISAVKKMQDMISYYPMIDSIYFVRYEDNFVLSNATSDQLSNYRDEPFIKKAMDPLSPKQWSGIRSFEQFSTKGSKPVVSLVRGAPFITGKKGMIVVNVATDRCRTVLLTYTIQKQALSVFGTPREMICLVTCILKNNQRFSPIMYRAIPDGPTKADL